MEFTIAGAVVIVLLAILGIVFLPRREELKQEEKVLPLYPDTRDRRGVRAVGRESRSDGERNASRSSERAGELRQDREVGVKRDPLNPTDAKGPGSLRDRGQAGRPAPRRTKESEGPARAGRGH